MSPSLPVTIIIAILTIFLFASHTSATYGSPCSSSTPSCELNQGLTCDLSSQTCTCINGTSLTSNLKCRALPNAPCEGARPCDEDNDVICRGFKCVCEGNDKLVGNKCVPALYGNCGPQRPPCDTNLVCRYGFCMCPEGQAADNDLRECRSIWNSSCDNNQLCYEKRGLFCGPSNRCECPRGQSPNEAGDCMVKLNDPCDPAASKCDWISNLNCSPTTQRCVCDVGLVPNAKGQCRLVYGDPCYDTHDLCDKTQLLSCGGNGKCGCTYGYSYSNGECLGGQISMMCSVNRTTANFVASTYYPDCDHSRKLECQRNGQCACIENYGWDWGTYTCVLWE